MHITSAAGVISLLDEPDDELQVYALNRLNDIVPEFWPEISDHVEKIEVLYENEAFKHREISALLASKLYYYLGSYEDSLNYALCAGSAFNVKESSEYVVTTICKCIDHYTKLRQQAHDAKADGDMKPDIDSRLEEIVNRMFNNCLESGQFKQAIGIAIETKRLDILEKAIRLTPNLSEMLSYCTNLCTRMLQHKGLREDILRLLVRLHSNLDPTTTGATSQPDYINICQCLIYLDDPASVSDILRKLIRGDQDQISLAYQIAFDLYDSASQHFLSDIVQALKAGTTPETTTTQTDETDAQVEEKAPPKPVAESQSDKVLRDCTDRLARILGGDESIELHLQFYIRNNHTDLQILKNTKDQVRNSVCHNACVIANGFMHCGTTIDQFLRDNLEWLARATNWAKFSATASLGVIHKGHENDSLNLMSTYLPKDSTGGSAYQEGGGLYALGLIHANHGKGKITDYLHAQLSSASNEIIIHGGCLGLGLASLGTANHDVYELLKSNLYQDDAVTGEAAGLSMGLVMMGSNNPQALEDMVAYAQETQHEKIIRGLAVGIALVMYGRMEEADSLIETLMRDKDPILRRCAVYTIAMAYVGSGSNKANRKLLHVAVSDVNNDVRRAAVESLGFILFRTPEQCPSVVSLLSESYNPHVRYGAAMALGISCAGTGSKDALGLLEPLASDSVNYVRQGALIASAMILIQHTDSTCPKLKTFKELYRKVINDKHEDVMAKFGAILAQGIIDGGGRNVTLSMQSRTGHVNMSAVVGMLVFCQFWYWFPLSHFLSLTFTPAAIIGLNAELKMPKMEFRSNARPSTFAYPSPLEEKKGRETEKVETAVLSTTAKQKAKDIKKEKRKASTSSTAVTPATGSRPPTVEEKMELDETEAKLAKKETPAQGEPSMEVEQSTTPKEKETEKEKEKEKEKPEASFEMISNPCRAIPPQLKVISMPEDSKYTSLKPLSHGGIILLKYKKSSEPEDLLEPVAAGGPKKEEVEEGDEPEPPEPFEFVE
uniref:26S proteasome non-ATPase regulatory subunit 1 n=1 Tax=Phallusia mammillata TaxID=59560 RepID=A0A6F9DQQ4_9ASCI|nr:26S proteasome non-ATPase regulatory subunit 1 [Phallusia mammillata]